MFLILVEDIILEMKVSISRADNSDSFGLRFRSNLEIAFPYNIDGYKFECVSISEFEIDDDRTGGMKVLVSLFTKNGKNVLK